MTIRKRQFATMFFLILCTLFMCSTQSFALIQKSEPINYSVTAKFEYWKDPTTGKWLADYNGSRYELSGIPLDRNLTVSNVTFASAGLGFRSDAIVESASIGSTSNDLITSGTNESSFVGLHGGDSITPHADSVIINTSDATSRYDAENNITIYTQLFKIDLIAYWQEEVEGDLVADLTGVTIAEPGTTVYLDGSKSQELSPETITSYKLYNNDTGVQITEGTGAPPSDMATIMPAVITEYKLYVYDKYGNSAVDYHTIALTDEPPPPPPDVGTVKFKLYDASKKGEPIDNIIGEMEVTWELSDGSDHNVLLPSTLKPSTDFVDGWTKVSDIKWYDGNTSKKRHILSLKSTSIDGYTIVNPLEVNQEMKYRETKGFYIGGCNDSNTAYIAYTPNNTKFQVRFREIEGADGEEIMEKAHKDFVDWGINKIDNETKALVNPAIGDSAKTYNSIADFEADFSGVKISDDYYFVGYNQLSTGGYFRGKEAQGNDKTVSIRSDTAILYLVYVPDKTEVTVELVKKDSTTVSQSYTKKVHILQNIDAEFEIPYSSPTLGTYSSYKSVNRSVSKYSEIQYYAYKEPNSNNGSDLYSIDEKEGLLFNPNIDLNKINISIGAIYDTYGMEYDDLGKHWYIRIYYEEASEDVSGKIVYVETTDSQSNFGYYTINSTLKTESTTFKNEFNNTVEAPAIYSKNGTDYTILRAESWIDYNWDSFYSLQSSGRYDPDKVTNYTSTSGNISFSDVIDHFGSDKTHYFVFYYKKVEAPSPVDKGRITFVSVDKDNENSGDLTDVHTETATEHGKTYSHSVDTKPTGLSGDEYIIDSVKVFNESDFMSHGSDATAIESHTYTSFEKLSSTASKGVETSVDNPELIVVFYYEKDTIIPPENVGKINIRCYDAKSNKLIDSNSIEGLELKTHPVPAPVISGYKAGTPSSHYVELTEAETEKTVDFYYEPEDIVHLEGKISVEYYDESDKLLKTDIQENKAFGEHTVHAVVVNTYELDTSRCSSPVTVELTEAEPEKTVKFYLRKPVPKIGKINIECYYEDEVEGDLLMRTFIEENLELKTHSIEAPLFHDYKLNSERTSSPQNVALTEAEPEKTVKFYYEKHILEGWITWAYIDESETLFGGQVAFDNPTTHGVNYSQSIDTIKVFEGTDYVVTRVGVYDDEDIIDAALNGLNLADITPLKTYTCSANDKQSDFFSYAVQTSLENPRLHVIFFYKDASVISETGEITIECYDKDDGNRLIKTENKTYELGIHTIPAPAINGYEDGTPATQSIELTESEKEKVAKFYYHQEEPVIPPDSGGTGDIVFNPNTSYSVSGNREGWVNRNIAVNVSIAGDKTAERSSTASRGYEYEEEYTEVVGQDEEGNDITETKTRTLTGTAQCSFTETWQVGTISVSGAASGTVSGMSGGNVTITREGDNMTLSGQLNSWESVQKVWNNDSAPNSGTWTDNGTPSGITEPPTLYSGISGTYRLDKTSPGSNTNIGSHWWTNVPYNVNLSITDNLSGFWPSGTYYSVSDRSYYRNNKGNTQFASKGATSGSVSIPINKNGVYTIHSRVEDIARNTYSRSYGEYRFDNVRPYTAQFSISGCSNVVEAYIPDAGAQGYIFKADFDNRLRVTIGDDLSGLDHLSTQRFKWTQSQSFPSVSSMNVLKEGTSEAINNPLYDSFYVYANHGSRHDNIGINDYHDFKGGVWYLHIYEEDRAGNITKTTSKPCLFIHLYDLKITNVTDFDFDSTFDDGKEFNVDDLALDETDHDESEVMERGYAFYFEIHSKGLARANDTVRIRPRFYAYNDITGQYDIRLDMYYETKKKPYVLATTDPDGAKDNYDTFEIYYERKCENYLGYHNEINLPTSLRRVLDTQRQTWKGRYGIPPTAMFCTPDKRPYPPKNLYKGKVLVKFDIEAMKSSTERYNYVFDRQWSREQKNISGTILNPYKYNKYTGGSMIVIDAKKSIVDDFEALPIIRNN